jgi:hypothetical protein
LLPSPPAAVPPASSPTGRGQFAHKASPTAKPPASFKSNVSFYHS